MIFLDKFPFILLVMTASLCCMRLLVSVHASPLHATLQDRAQLNDRGLPYNDPPDHAGRIFLGYCYDMLVIKIRQHDGFNALVKTYVKISIQPSCDFCGTHPNHRRDQYAQITVDETQFSKLDYRFAAAGVALRFAYHDSSSLFLYQLYSSKYLLAQDQNSFIRSKRLDPDKTIIVSPSLHIGKDPKFLDDLILVFPNSLLLPSRESSDKNQNPLQIDAKEVDSGKFVDWRDWPKGIIDLPPDLKPRP
ncbi:hypothetical protein C8J55DRAFT_492571 [Lentinula edodes]|uniref:Uncharacterized protein n=1 Tax=Lentinula lateritia TaxID=40482 RepID=A0A9W8ZX08_9AGAR|nr:hypothetical protein C8J55DRAFT_492571 [Lentinula edodes]